MRTPDIDKERCERKLTLAQFLKAYNEGLPEGFPRATSELLKEYRKHNPAQFKPSGKWSLDQHRKKFMDWLPMHLRSVEA